MDSACLACARVAHDTRHVQTKTSIPIMRFLIESLRPTKPVYVRIIPMRSACSILCLVSTRLTTMYMECIIYRVVCGARAMKNRCASRSV
jgi:hypothetical protein